MTDDTQLVPRELAERYKRERNEVLNAAMLLADEYEDRRAQWGNEYLWQKHERSDEVNASIETIRRLGK